MSSVTYVLVEKDGARYTCKPGRDGNAKCGKCLRGVIPFIDARLGSITNPVGKKCKVCGAKVAEWGVRPAQD